MIGVSKVRGWGWTGYVGSWDGVSECLDDLVAEDGGGGGGREGGGGGGREGVGEGSWRGIWDVYGLHFAGRRCGCVYERHL